MWKSALGMFSICLAMGTGAAVQGQTSDTKSLIVNRFGCHVQLPHGMFSMQLASAIGLDATAARSDDGAYLTLSGMDVSSKIDGISEISRQILSRHDEYPSPTLIRIR